MRIGIIGYHINSGIGSLIDDLKAQLPIESHFVVPQQKQGIDLNKPTCCPIIISGADRNAQLEAWVTELDAVICVEFVPWDDVLPALCQRHNTKIICIVDIDWFDHKCSWTRNVTTFISPNTYTHRQMQLYGFRNSVMIPGCVDTDYFQYKPRDICQEFLFNNGWGGYRHRKGLDLVTIAAQNVSATVYINSQASVDIRWPNVEVNAGNQPDRRSLFTRGQVYLAPTRCEGYGLHILEAMACGYPVLCTAGHPMTDYVTDPAWQIATRSAKQLREARFTAMWYEPCAKSLTEKMQALTDTSVADVSHATRELVELRHSWKRNRDAYLKVLSGE